MKLIGLRYRFGSTIIDPVMPAALNGLRAALSYRGKRILFEFSVDGENMGVRNVEVNGAEIPFGREGNPYRKGGAGIGDDVLEQAPNRKENRIVVSL